jgi:polyhydroxybutyrate depolymerase
VKNSVLLMMLFVCTEPVQAQQRAGLSPGNHEITLRHGGRERIAIVHVPPRAAGRDSLPLLLALHGGGGEAAGFRDYAGLDPVADREGFVVVYPYGSGQIPRRLLTWNGGGCCGFARNRSIDDVGFLIALVDDVARRVIIDKRRVYATGHSNGAIMAYRLAAERAERIAAIVPVAGAMNVERFAPTRAVPVLHIHSVDDPRALYNGGIGPPFPLTNQRVEHKSVTESLNRWSEVNGCAREARAGATRAGTGGARGVAQTATLLSYGPCRSGAEVMHWKMTGVGHGWPGERGSGLPENIIGPRTTLINAADEIFSFVKRFTLPNPRPQS